MTTNQSGKKRGSGLRRWLRYFHLRFIRLRGKPHELALGMAFGIFTGSMPIMPFQIALAIALSMVFKGSKIAAALGTWISNPANWYFLYYYSYKIGARILGLRHTSEMFHSIMSSVHQGEDGMVIAEKIMDAGGSMVAAFLLGGLILGLVIAPPSYFIFLRLFRSMEEWRQRRAVRRWQHRSI
ncbi:MAG: DUF2062 domain-containing protein [Deltaproteobacteria bacterium]|nr:DUF2062 domain-containing protein [Deltaproteobacteria bacterium]